jgi:molybdenum cofactor guanylyltransferase
MPPLTREQITGLVLAGGLGQRMGGVDKGLQPYRGSTLMAQALQRLAPQVGPVLISANRNLDEYRRFGPPVHPDPLPGHAGPLAGFWAGLQHCSTPYLLTVPCDSPHFPLDLVARLASALQGGTAPLAMACCRSPAGALLRQPVFCLMARSLLPSVQRFVQSGQHKVGQWLAAEGCIEVEFGDPEAFANANTPAELQALGQLSGPPLTAR